MAQTVKIPPAMQETQVSMNKYQLSTDHMPEVSEALNYISKARWQKPLPDGAHTILSLSFFYYW